MKRIILYLLLFICTSAVAENSIVSLSGSVIGTNCFVKSSPKVNGKLPTLTFFSKDGYANSLLQTGTECPTLFRIKNQKLSLFDLRRQHSPLFTFFQMASFGEEKQRPAWMYLFYQAILFPEHYYW
ncbi:MAG: hypothetical protein EOO10_02790 [Chitinophagaceae bacterium]|nr:MAG: hypothetical protein EOO10_02790 [Chitinophagaceae bacterium]